MRLARPTRSLLRRAAGAALVLAIGAGCGDTPPPTPPNFDPVGTWAATTFLVTTETGPHDIVAMGGSISVTLHENGRISGSYVYPEVDGNESFELLLDGTWTLHSQTRVIFSHTETSYLEFINFSGSGTVMEGEGSASGTIINIVLHKTS